MACYRFYLNTNAYVVYPGETVGAALALLVADPQTNPDVCLANIIHIEKMEETGTCEIC